MIIDSSKDHLTGRISIAFYGNVPSYVEVSEHCLMHFAFLPRFDYEVRRGNDFMGFVNHGRIIIETMNCENN